MKNLIAVINESLLNNPGVLAVLCEASHFNAAAVSTNEQNEVAPERLLPTQDEITAMSAAKVSGMLKDILGDYYGKPGTGPQEKEALRLIAVVVDGDSQEVGKTGVSYLAGVFGITAKKSEVVLKEIYAAIDALLGEQGEGQEDEDVQDEEVAEEEDTEEVAEEEAPEEAPVAEEEELAEEKATPKKVVKSISEETFFAEIEKLRNEFKLSQEPKVEEPKVELSKEVEDVSGISHNPEKVSDKKQLHLYAQKGKNSILNTIYNKINK